jgi:glycosyltransferase involved in cell wall biosynthesis
VGIFTWRMPLSQSLNDGALPTALPVTDQPLVSIITPTFRHEQFIGSCLRSVRDQTYGNWELIVADDASPDQTAAIVAEQAARDSRIRLLKHPTNYGPARLHETYNEALALCRGELVAVLEGDDEWLPEKLERQLPAFADPQVVLCYSDFEEVTTGGLVIGRHGILDAVQPARSKAGDNLRFFSKLTSFGSNTVVVRRDQLLEVGGFRNVAGMFVDYPTWLSLVPLGDFMRVAEILGRWRRHPASLAYASYEQKTLVSLQQHFLGFVASERERLVASGIDQAELDELADSAARMLQEKVRSAAYYEGKYHLMFGKRVKAAAVFGRTLLHPRTTARHRLGALAGVFAAVTSPQLFTYFGEVARDLRARRSDRNA